MNTQVKPYTSLKLNQLIAEVNLGWTEEERSQKQKIAIDIQIEFINLPKACFSDQLSDTVCYQDLTVTIEQFLQKKSFQLVEHLGKELHHCIKKEFVEPILLTINITKNPPVKNLMGGIHFCYSDH